MHISDQRFQEVTFNTVGLEPQFQDQTGEDYRTLMDMLLEMDMFQRHLRHGPRIDRPQQGTHGRERLSAHRQPGSRQLISPQHQLYMSVQHGSQRDKKGVNNGLVC